MMATAIYWKPVTLFLCLLLALMFTLIYFFKSDKSEHIVVGTVSCHKPNAHSSNRETAVMIKSVLISAQFSNVFYVDFHIFLEHLEDISYFSQKLEEYGCQDNICNGVRINLKFYPAINFTLIPEKYLDIMLYHKRLRCNFVRMFFPTMLPDVESIIYFDTDTIVTGNIAQIWDFFGEMDPNQLLGIPRDMEEDNSNYKRTWNNSFGDIPHVPPKGLNTGILLMDLKKMRKFGWEKKLLRLYEDYSKLSEITIQRLINILLYYNPGLHKLLTCEYHIFNKHCDQGLYCDYLEDSKYGIHVIHGAGDTFATSNGSMYDIFQTYRTFNMTHGNFVDDVVKRIRKIYGGPQKPNVKQSKCYGILNKYLFNNFFDEKGKLL